MKSSRIAPFVKSNSAPPVAGGDHRPLVDGRDGAVQAGIAEVLERLYAASLGMVPLGQECTTTPVTGA